MDKKKDDKSFFKTIEKMFEDKFGFSIKSDQAKNLTLNQVVEFEKEYQKKKDEYFKKD